MACNTLGGVVLSLGLVLQLSAVAHGESIPLVDIDPIEDVGVPSPDTFYGFNEPNGGQWGWLFSSNEPIEITHVAWHDENRDGLSHGHTIQLWEVISSGGGYGYEYIQPLLPELTSDPLASGVEVRAGDVEEIDGPWRRRALPTPITLAPGEYVLAGTDSASSTDAIRYAKVDYPQDLIREKKDPRLSGYFVPGTGQYGQQLDFPWLVIGIELGPMLFVTPIPEPGGALLCLFACALTGAVRCRC